MLAGAFLLVAYLAEKLDGPAGLTHLCVLIAFILGGIPGLQSAWESLLERRVDIDVLMVLGAGLAAIIGQPIELDCPSPKTSFAVVFEDDGKTGYFYGLDLENKKQPVLDSLLIYNVKDMLDPNVSVTDRYTLVGGWFEIPADDQRLSPCHF